MSIHLLFSIKDIIPKWQTAASDLIVSLGKKFRHEVMGELLENLIPGTLPHYFVILTLANYAQADGKSSLYHIENHLSCVSVLRLSVRSTAGGHSPRSTLTPYVWKQKGHHRSPVWRSAINQYEIKLD